MSQPAHQQEDRDKQDTASGSQLPPWGVIKRLFSFKAHSLVLVVLRRKVTAPSQASVWKCFLPHDPKVCLDLVSGPVLPLSASGGLAAHLQLDTPAWGSAGTAGALRHPGGGCGPGSLESLPRVSPRTARRPRRRSPLDAGGRTRPQPACARATYRGTAAWWAR